MKIFANHFRKFWLIICWGGIVTSLVFPPFFSWADTSITTVTVPAFSPPTGLRAVAVSSSRIDLSWSAAVGAIGYKVYRDGVFVGAPTVTSYSDTGLRPRTTYTYTVSSVNVYSGESARCAPVSATTLATEEEGTPLEPDAPEVIPEEIPEHPEIAKSIVINNNALYTNSLEVVLSLSARKAEQMAISDRMDFAWAVWEPYQESKEWTLPSGEGKKNVYAKFRSIHGIVSKIVSDSIIVDTVAPSNVMNLQIESGDGQAALTWKNPPDNDLEGIWIRRGSAFYPVGPLDGELVYNGIGEAFLDEELTNGVAYYYSVFAYDEAGNFSSGALTMATPQSFLPPVTPVPPQPPIEPTPPIIPIIPVPPIEPTPPVPPISYPQIEGLTLEDFNFTQDNVRLFIAGAEEVSIGGKKPVTISIDYEKLPEVLKTIVVTLRKDGKAFSFLLRINPEMTVYEAKILPPSEEGAYEMIVTILDYKNQTLKNIFGELIVEGFLKEFIMPLSGDDWYSKFQKRFLLIVMILVLLIIGYWIWKQRREYKKVTVENVPSSHLYNTNGLPLRDDKDKKRD